MVILFPILHESQCSFPKAQVSLLLLSHGAFPLLGSWRKLSNEMYYGGRTSCNRGSLLKVIEKLSWQHHSLGQSGHSVCVNPRESSARDTRREGLQEERSVVKYLTQHNKHTFYLEEWCSGLQGSGLPALSNTVKVFIRGIIQAGR